jgi:hypothetical protein
MDDDDFNEDEEFDFQYSGSEEGAEVQIDLENAYYEAKSKLVFLIERLQAK